MVDQLTILAILQASVTGAGLILTAYALILPNAGRILKRNATMYNREYDLFQKIVLSTKAHEFSDEKKEEIEDLMRELNEIKTLPKSLSWVGVAFILYMACTVFSIMWLLGSKLLYEDFIPHLFLLATLLSAIIGWEVFTELTQSLKIEYEDTKKETCNSKKEKDSSIQEVS
jgi:hypothetical protein